MDGLLGRLSQPRRRGRATWRRYTAFLRRPPELSMAWHDAVTGARAWLVINSQRGGAAGGGTRMRLGLEPREVVYLAKAMELKFALAGPPIGGAKTGIDFNPADPRKADVLERWWRAIEPTLRERYGTAGDLNVDEVAEVIPILGRIGLEHPQQGIVYGHLRPEPDEYRVIMGRLRAGVEATVTGAYGVAGADFTVADIATGYGVACAVRRLLSRQGRGVAGARVLVEGFGNVGAACALYLARSGARIVAISDARHTLIEPDGMDATDVETLVRDRNGKLLSDGDVRVRAGAGRADFWETPADVFVCAALSQSVTEQTLDRLASTGVGIIACGANQPFRERKIGSTRVAQLADRRFSVIPDIIANCGMARTFSYLMEPAARPAAETIIPAIEQTIETTLDEAIDRAEHARTELLAATLGMALDRVGAA